MWDKSLKMTNLSCINLQVFLGDRRGMSFFYPETLSKGRKFALKAEQCSVFRNIENLQKNFAIFWAYDKLFFLN